MFLLLPETANELLNIIDESMNVVNWLNMTMEFHFYYNRKSHTKYVNITSDNCKNRVKLYICCLFGVYCPTREFFTYMETSSLPVKGCKF